MVTVIGKIEKISLGFYGEQFGVVVRVAGPGWGAETFQGVDSLNLNIEFDTGRTWHLEVMKELVGISVWVAKTLNEAKKTSLDELNGMPVEVTFDSAKLVSWRILHEVL